ncbi:hypothetical protein [Duganella fentianensis]|uniref:hypothetical protein n=1 Tax=Duganella fentianensis TaxID=2692177 RepID=UPI0032B20A74
MQQHELQFALLLHTQHRLNEPVLAIPRSVLRTLFDADRSLSQALEDAIYDSAPFQRDVYISDKNTAVRLVDLGIIAPAALPNQYVLLDIEVR